MAARLKPSTEISSATPRKKRNERFSGTIDEQIRRRHLNQTLARRIGRYLECQGLLECDVENTYLAADDLEAGPMEQLLGSAITYRIAIAPQQGRKVFTLQTLPTCDERFDDGVGKVAGFHSVHHDE